MRGHFARTTMVAVLILGTFGTHANADPQTFWIDPSQSYLTVGFWQNGSPDTGGTLITQSQTGTTSETTSLSGSLSIDTSGGQIAFETPGSPINLAYQPTNLLPDPNGGNAAGPDPAGTGGAPAQEAGQLNPSVGLGVGYFSASGESFNVSGDTPLNPVSATESVFSATAETLSVSIGNYAAWVDSQYFGFNFGNATGLSYGGQNGVDRFGNIYVGTGTLTTVDGVSTITLPVFADLYIYVVGVNYPSDVVWTGQIVASTVPEPSTLVLATTAVLSAATWSLFRRRSASRKS